MKTKYLVTIVAVAVIALGVVYFSREPKESVAPSEPRPLGAVSTLDAVDSPYVSIGGLKQYYWSSQFAATSSIICSTRLAATSTMEQLAVKITSNPLKNAATGATSLTYDVATSSSQFADNSGYTYGSSSPAFVLAYNPGIGQDSMIWGGVAATSSEAVAGRVISGGLKKSTTGALKEPWFIKSGEWLTVRIASSSPPALTSYLKGQCTAIFTQL